MLYLAKLARPDLSTIVSFLCKDSSKLDRVLGYLKGMPERVLWRQTNSEIRIHVDAVYGLQVPHGSDIMYRGETPLLSSKKQKCTSKSPTEAELIVLTNNLGFVELLQNSCYHEETEGTDSLLELQCGSHTSNHGRRQD